MDTGTRLREARRERRLTLDDVARRTKIPVGTLRAIDCNDVARLPRGIFFRGFVRAYAAEVGLNPEELLQESTAGCEVVTYEADYLRLEDVTENKSANRIQLVAIIAIGVLLVLFTDNYVSRDVPVVLPPTLEPPFQSQAAMPISVPELTIPARAERIPAISQPISQPVAAVETTQISGELAAPALSDVLPEPAIAAEDIALTKEPAASTPDPR
jgi:cytoskeletal protein RodZ